MAGNSSFNTQVWDKLKLKLKKEVGDTAYNNWLKQLSFSSFEEDTITFSVQTKFLRDWIATHYAEKIKNICKQKIENLNILKIVVKRSGGRVMPGTERLINTEAENKKEFDVRRQQALSYPEDFGAPLDPRFTFENFVGGKPNELAFAAAKRICEVSKVTFNPLFLYGGVGLGKTLSLIHI